MLSEINNRRSVRKYESKDIDEKTILELIEAGLNAPSAKNNQPWRFVIVRNEKNKIADKMEEVFGANKTAQVIREVPILLLVYNDGDEYFNHLSIGACIENILLEATHRGLGSLWIGYIKKIEDYVNILTKVDMELVSAIAIGYPLEEPIKRPRKELEEIILKEI